MPINLPSGMIALVLTVMALFAVSATAEAAVPFGSTLNQNPIDGGCNIGGNPFPPCTYVEFKHKTDGPADPSGAPVAGVVTKIRMKSQNGGEATFHLADVSRPDPNNDSVGLAKVGPGQTVTVANLGQDVIQEFPVRLVVAKGQHLAMDTSTVDAIDSNGGGTFTHIFNPPLAIGGNLRASTGTTGELIVQGIIEPDADGDGFGDETQDACPKQKTTFGACDVTKPKVSSLGITGGKKIAFRLGEKASVALSVEKAAAGRKVSGKCRKPTRKNAKKRRCTRYVKVKGLKVAGQVGINRASLKRKLGKGRYRLVAVATDPAGNKSTTTKKFRVR